MKSKVNELLIPNLGYISIISIVIILGVVIGQNSLNLREKIRQQIITRDSEVLYPITVLQITKAKDRILFEPWSFESELDLLSVVLDSSELKGVISVRLFDVDGILTEAVPKSFKKGALTRTDVSQLIKLEPLSRYHENIRLSEFIHKSVNGNPAADSIVPLLEVIIPLHDKESDAIEGIAQFLIDGSDIKNEFAKLDKNLLQQSVINFIIGSIVVSMMLIWSFHRLNKLNIEISIDDCIDDQLENHRSNILILILMNLVQNAIEAIEENGTITLISKQSDSHNIIKVSDTGTGISESIKLKLFQPVKSDKKKGNGIGLSISRQLARHLGDELSLEKTDEFGTCFTVTFPKSTNTLNDENSNQTSQVVM